MKKFIKVLSILDQFGYSYELILEYQQIRVEIYANVAPDKREYVNWVIAKDGVIYLGANKSGYSHVMKVREFSDYVEGIEMCVNASV
jgi:hypothetical protein